MILKKPISYDEQVDKLISDGMIISNREKVLDFLSKNNYYRFVGYALQFRVTPNDGEYITGTTFESVQHIYYFDESLRNILKKYIEITEIYFRTKIAYGFSMIKCIKEPYDQHYDQNNFYNKDGYKKIMESVDKEKGYYKDSLIVKHHNIKYAGKMPLWVMVELMSYSNLSKLYSAMYISEKKLIAQNIGIGYRTLENHLHCLSVLRNKCAHAARLYNTDFNPPVIFSTSFLQKNPNIKNNSLFAYILMLIKRLPKNEYKKTLADDICVLMKKYINIIDNNIIGFPKEYQSIFINNL